MKRWLWFCVAVSLGQAVALTCAKYGMYKSPTGAWISFGVFILFTAIVELFVEDREGD